MNLSSNIMASNNIPGRNETQTRLLTLRLELFEKHLLNIYTSICAYTRKISRTRDEGDLLASHITQFADSEKINNTMRECIKLFADDLFALQDIKHAQIQKLEVKVINEISFYGDIIRKAKEELKSNHNTRNKFMNQRKDSSKNSSMNEASSAQKEYEQQVKQFEAKKIIDIKRFFLDFAKIELHYHAKGVEIMTQAYKHVLEMDQSADLDQFCRFYNLSGNESSSLMNKRSPSHSSLNTEMSQPEINTSNVLRRFHSVPSFTSRSSSQSGQKNEKSLDDEEDDDEDSSEGEENANAKKSVKSSK